ncbi:RNA polymerase, sigma-24 subunit, ECF subfamily [Catenulispora acidiphila DSM 44928]|uniref:RNA polymerase, sigma-24 subunit, ECF subfamily n=1 Tax=Catenulispora acidiphila (strain DSM 44928 / JCM 14897 / NBRC 102108 / NRRL B-24433 / ID139908) TaxID=479433 RepID=C7Q0T3_CATAD|nr:SigE family RNA polymerase sigma factor [Catenulispora acidiphila]ACU69711.1 RNA polymerase, sigma-24 subunit, ECF subfamily [Catenulispora acidiphila DSM 44928]
MRRRPTVEAVAGAAVGDAVVGGGVHADADVDAEFQAYMAARWPVLVRTAFLLTGDRFLAEDLAQTALTRVYASWRRVRRADDVDAYVRRVLVNANSGRFRKRRVVEHLVAVPLDGRGHAPHEPLAQRSALMAALAELPARQRAVVVLRYWEDLPEKEVAAVLGCSTGTVKSQASKALARLRNSAVLVDHDSVLAEPGRKEPE